MEDRLENYNMVQNYQYQQYQNPYDGSKDYFNGNGVQENEYAEIFENQPNQFTDINKLIGNDSGQQKNKNDLFEDKSHYDFFMNDPDKNLIDNMDNNIFPQNQDAQDFDFLLKEEKEQTQIKEKKIRKKSTHSKKKNQQENDDGSIKKKKATLAKRKESIQKPRKQSRKKSKKIQQDQESEVEKNSIQEQQQSSKVQQYPGSNSQLNFNQNDDKNTSQEQNIGSYQKLPEQQQCFDQFQQERGQNNQEDEKIQEQNQIYQNAQYDQYNQQQEQQQSSSYQQQQQNQDQKVENYSQNNQNSYHQQNQYYYEERNQYNQNVQDQNYSYNNHNGDQTNQQKLEQNNYQQQQYQQQSDNYFQRQQGDIQYQQDNYQQQFTQQETLQNQQQNQQNLNDTIINEQNNNNLNYLSNSRNEQSECQIQQPTQQYSNNIKSQKSEIRDNEFQHQQAKQQYSNDINNNNNVNAGFESQNNEGFKNENNEGIQDKNYQYDSYGNFIKQEDIQKSQEQVKSNVDQESQQNNQKKRKKSTVNKLSDSAKTTKEKKISKKKQNQEKKEGKQRKLSKNLEKSQKKQKPFNDNSPEFYKKFIMQMLTLYEKSKNENDKDDELKMKGTLEEQNKLKEQFYKNFQNFYSKRFKGNNIPQPNYFFPTIFNEKSKKKNQNQWILQKYNIPNEEMLQKIKEDIGPEYMCIFDIPFQDLHVRKNSDVATAGENQVQSQIEIKRQNRKQKVEKYLEKRRRSRTTQPVVFDIKKKMADDRLRYKGRFVTRDQAQTYLDEDIQKMNYSEIQILLNIKCNQRKNSIFSNKGQTKKTPSQSSMPEFEEDKTLPISQSEFGSYAQVKVDQKHNKHQFLQQQQQQYEKINHNNNNHINQNIVSQHAYTYDQQKKQHDIQEVSGIQYDSMTTQSPNQNSYHNSQNINLNDQIFQRDIRKNSQQTFEQE